MEGGRGQLPLFEGRPSIEAILQDILDQTKASEVSVHSAGATSLPTKRKQHMPCVCGAQPLHKDHARHAIFCWHCIQPSKPSNLLSMQLQTDQECTFLCLASLAIQTLSITQELALLNHHAWCL